MFKKVLFGTILFALIAVLGIGAAIRTMDRTSTYNGDLGQGQGRGRASDSTAPVGGGNETAPGQAQTESPRWGQQTQAQAATTVVGTVASVNENALTMKLADGSQIVVENRPWWFAQEQKFAAQVGDQIKLTGFSYNGTFETVKIENSTSGKTVQLRDEYGRPGWSGRGQRGG
ncbi:MAG: hypothetical protein L0Y55_05880 [Anaerolineales bacterium]|nr:hypothetical protein [Anaerolineales bacterium]